MSRGYTLINVPWPPGWGWAEVDLKVALMEHVRLRLPEWDPWIPPEAELDLLASGTPHNEGPVPLLAMHLPPGAAWAPAFRELDKLVEGWVAGRTDSELRAVAAATPAPTWEALRASGVHPTRRDPA